MAIMAHSNSIHGSETGSIVKLVAHLTEDRTQVQSHNIMWNNFYDHSLSTADSRRVQCNYHVNQVDDWACLGKNISSLSDQLDMILTVLSEQ